MPPGPALSNELNIILDFVEGRTKTRQFEQLFYGNLKPFEAFFSYDPQRPDDVPGLYLFLVTLDYGDPDAVLNAQEMLANYLQRRGISFRATGEHADLTHILHAAQPEWLDVDAAWIQSEVLPEAGNREGDELRQWLENRLLALFQFIKSPPQWLQQPEWPIGPNGPLLFLGVVDTEDYLGHGEQVFVFYDTHDGTTSAVIQTEG
jgi:hypothetical protein